MADSTENSRGESGNRFQKHRRKFLLLMLCVIGFFALLAAEGITRIVKARRHQALGGAVEIRFDYEGHRPGLYTYPKNVEMVEANEEGQEIVCRTDALGLRNPQEVHASDAPLTIVLGDSFIAGVNTPEPETFARLLESRGDGFRVLNAGMDGFGPIHMLQMLEMLLDEGYVPARVVVAVYMGNDLRDDYLAWDLYQAISASGGGSGEGGEVASPNRLLELAKAVGRRSELAKSVRDALREPDPFDSYFRSELELYKNEPDEAFLATAREVTDWCFGQFATLARHHGFALSVVLIPSKVQVYEELAFLPRFGAGGYEADRAAMLHAIRGGYDVARLERDFVELLEARKIEYVSLTAPFRRLVDEGVKPYGQLDRHWNRIGQAAAADCVLAFLAGQPATSAKPLGRDGQAPPLGSPAP